MNEDREKKTCMNRYGKRYLLIAVIVALCLFSAAALEITDQYSLEYPGCLLLREIKIWNINTMNSRFIISKFSFAQYLKICWGR